MENEEKLDHDVSAVEISPSSTSRRSPEETDTTEEKDRLLIIRIQELYPKLKLKILPQSIATRMFQRKALPQDVLERVQSTGDYNLGAQIILNYVMKSGPILAACFMDALKETKQDDVINMLQTGKEYHLKTSHCDLLQRHYEFLLGKIDISSSSLLNKLDDYEVLDKNDLGDIKAERPDWKQIAKLLSILSRKSTLQFRSFLRALNETGQQHVEAELKRDEQDGDNLIQDAALQTGYELPCATGNTFVENSSELVALISDSIAEKINRSGGEQLDTARMWFIQFAAFKDQQEAEILYKSILRRIPKKKKVPTATLR